ncbi:MAG: DUF2948 family protein [Alphaproteobacteria bacterium]|nr:DUF2948 family protein [Alphaproteobacteria bacterium]
MDQLKLVALDRDDIEVVSAHLQDAVLKAADIHWRPAERRVVIALNRFDWETANDGTPGFRRCRTALRFERVLACQCRNIDAAAKDQTLNLLAVAFDESDPPAGAVTLTFSGAGVLRLQVECLEAELADLGPAWGTDCCPEHSVGDVGLDEKLIDAKPSAPRQQG